MGLETLAMDKADLFKTAPLEVTRYFEAKDNVPTFDWRDIAPKEHAFSWTVAKSAGFDILDDIRDAVDDAITNRIPFEQFQNQLTPILKSKGWWGKQRVVDPKSGFSKLAQLGSPRRLKTIYWANTRTAYAAGEWERTQRNKTFLPFLLYTLSAAERRRPEHQGWVGIVLPVDHPFWNTHYPPNGWGCKCGVRQITQREAQALGWSEDKEEPTIIYENWHNKRTGEMVQVPKGIDAGWQNNPGRSRQDNSAEFLFGRINKMPLNRQRIAIEDIVGSPILKAMVDGNMPKTYLPVAQLPKKLQIAVSAQTPIVRLSDDSIRHIIYDDPSRTLNISDLRNALSVISSPHSAIRSNRGNAIVLLGEVGGIWWRVVTKPTKNGNEWWLQSFHKKSNKEANDVIERSKRNGRLIE